MSGGGNIKVVVRCRPLNSRELARGAKGLIKMEGNNTYLEPPEQANVTSGSSRAIEKETKSFAFDKSYWSACSKDDPSYASQQTLYDDLGKDLLDHSFQGFNTCIFAYGQTGSGKSYSMMGYGSDRGIIPLICEALFDRIREREEKEEGLKFTVEVSYTEIYQEKVRDLLNPSNKGTLKVREHPTLGPYVENLSKCAVVNFQDIEHLMDEGTKARTVAATNMNETSSRSHAVFTLLLTQKRLDPVTQMIGEKVSRISLVDLAGSERANSTGATGTRLKEGALINKSLTTLGRVIAALAAASGGGKEAKKAAEKVPYRDSVLTWLLKDSLGGNSKTAMIAAISPADYDETLSTLRYADQAKKIKNKAVVNEDPNAKLIRELKEELQTLRQRMSGPSSGGGGVGLGIGGGVNGSPSLPGESTWDTSLPPEKQLVQYKTTSGEIKTISKAELQDQLEASEKLMASVTETWEQKLEKTKEVQKEREKALESLGITIEKNLLGVHTPKKMPHLVNLNEDPLMSECLIYQIKQGKTTVGNSESDKAADIKLSGANILPEHCYFECTTNEEDGSDVVTLHAGQGSTTMVNGLRLPPGKPKELKSGFRIILGDFHVFRFNHPEEVRKARETAKARADLRSPLLDTYDDTAASSPRTRPESPMSVAGENADWSYARREAVVARLNGKDVNLDALKDDDLNKLYSSILKVRHSRTSSSATSVASGDRPESRMSFLDSVTEDGDDEEDSSEGAASRPYSGSTWTTNPTSMADSTLTLNNLPDLYEKPFGIDGFDNFSDRLPSSISTPPSLVTPEKDQNVAERKAMEEKLKKLEKKMATQRKRLEKIRKSAPNSTGQFDDLFDDDYAPLTPEQFTIAKNVVARWRKRRRIRMAEDALSQAVLLKEANVMSRELKKGVSYQFVVIDGNLPKPSLGQIAGLDDIEEDSDPALSSSIKPCVGVKVLDRCHQSVSIWSLDKLRLRLEQMRNVYKWLDKPEYSQHFALEDPFYESPNGCSLIGTALISLAPLAHNMPSKQSIQIYSPFIADPIGSCRISLRPLGSSSVPPSTVLSDPPAPLVEGADIEVEVTVDNVQGLDKSEFASLHAQFSSSSLFDYPAPTEETFASDEIDLLKQPSSSLRLSRKLTVSVTSDLLDSLRSSHGQVAFFARPRLAHLDKLEHWDEARDGAATSKQLNAPPVRGDPLNGDVTRRPENEFILEQRHDVLAKVEICELGERGEYIPVTVVSSNSLDGGSFFLRQGLQRRIVINLSHNSGRAFGWKRISNVSLGNVRMLDGRGRIHAATSTADATLRGIGNPRPQFESDGNSTLSFAGAWDSSVHDSPHLNCNTPSGSRALLRLNFSIEASGIAGTIPFSTDIAVTISSRDARPPSKLLNMLTSTRLSSRITSVFAVRLSPHSTRKPGEIWRLDTSEMYVRGEETLAGWKPRGLTLVRDYGSSWTNKTKSADVEGTKAILTAFELTLPTVEDLPREDRLKQIVELWSKRFGSLEEISLEREQPSQAFLDLASPSPSPSIGGPASSPKLSGTSSLVLRSETFTKRGPLAILRDPTSNEWRKFWFVLRRPYLHLYSSSGEIEEVAVINVSTVRVEQSPEIEQMLDRKFAFAIFTPQNSYFFSAPTLRDMLDWIKAIDPSLTTA